jgi:ABC-type transport system involved in multi-copper enzyme maturation permease subunit
MVLGVSRIEYRPWKGDRTDPNWRFLVIARYVFLKNMKAKAVIAILIIGILLAHMFPIISALLFPHEEVTDADMIGNRWTQPPRGEESYTTSGSLQLTLFDGRLRVNGDFVIEGNLTIMGHLSMDSGTLGGNGTITGPDMVPDGFVYSNGPVELQGIVIFANGIITGTGFIQGDVQLNGSGVLSGEAVEDQASPDSGVTGSDGYLTWFIFLLFTMLLAAIICAEIISDDLADSSFVLYFSRPVRTFDYLAGKAIGLSLVMGIYCLLLPLIFVMVMIGTQTGSDYGNGLRILGLTVVAGIVTSLFFLPYGLMISSLTKRKAYAGVGIFMTFFVLTLIGGIFSTFDDTWMLIDPFSVLTSFFVLLFGGYIDPSITGPEVAASMLVFTVIPMVVVYLWVERMGAGK